MREWQYKIHERKELTGYNQLNMPVYNELNPVYETNGFELMPDRVHSTWFYSRYVKGKRRDEITIVG